MADLRIVDAPLLSTVKGTEKLPTGGEGNFSVSIDQVADFAKLKWVLATEGYVDTAVNGVRSELVTHVNAINNPHQVTKDQVGLGNVDNTADVDKPIGSATQAALATLTQNKAEKTYVDTQLNSKADKATTYSKSESDSLLAIKSDTSYVNTKYSSHIKTFLNTGAALANTANGEYFFIISSDAEKVEDLYLNVNGVATNQNKSELSSLLQHNSILGRDAIGAHQATSIGTSSGVTQQAINDFGGAKWHNKLGGYDFGATTKLANGDVVKSTVSNNIINPNVDMTGWKFNDNTVESIAELIAIQSPKDDQTIFVKSQLSNGLVGGGYYTYNSSKSSWDKIVTNLIISPETFGAAIDKPDNTQEIQKALLFVQTHGGYVDGGYKKYKAANIVIDSNMSLRNIYLENNVFDQNLISVITTAEVDEQRTPLRNVQLINVHIDGKRSELTNMPTGAFSEDGGRHGFRFIRPMQDVVIRGCSANYCGVEGILIFPIRNIPHAEWKHYVKNVVIENCDFHFNGRHGGSSDSADGLFLRNIRASGNGLDVVGGAPQTSGGAGRKDPSSGKLYGVGWDFEEYLSEAYSINISVEYCVMTGNAGSGVAFVRTGGILQPTRNVTFLGGKYDKGVAGVSDSSIRLGGYLIDFYNWYDITFIDVDFSGDKLYILRSKATLINPKNISVVSVNDQSTLVSDTRVDVTNSSSTISFNAKLDVRADGVGQQLLIRTNNVASSVSSLVFWDTKNASSRASIDVVSNSSSDTSLFLSVNNARKWEVQANGSLMPNSDSTQSIGWTTKRVNSIYLANAPVVGSDAKYKADVLDISETEKLVALELKKNIKSYRLKSDSSKIHIGAIAQEVVFIFEKHGLDAHDYNMIELSDGYYSIRYEELIMFILSA